MKLISANHAATLLGISIDSLNTLKKQGLIHPSLDNNGQLVYSPDEIERIKSRKGLTLSQEAMQVDISIQREMASSISFVKKIFMLVGGTLFIYAMLVIVFTALFIAYPLQTAQWLGMVKTKTYLSLSPVNMDSKVLGTETGVSQESSAPVQILLQPAGKIALGFVRSIRPDSYSQVSQVAILDTNDVLGLDSNGEITPQRPINLPDSSYIKVGSSELVPNLNAQYIQNHEPGTRVGDLALVGETITTPSPIFIQSVATVSGLTNTHLSGSAGITNSNLAHSSITIHTSNPLSGGGSLSLGESLTLTCPDCIISDTKINGSTLGATTPTSGNILIADGSSWITQALTGDATITSGGIVTLKSVGTPNTYGSTLSIPVFITDHAGRVTSAIDTPISGLTTSHFSSENISQWNNNIGYITPSSSDVFSNKTITAENNTISGITNSNLSGLAGISNANLENSNVTTVGNSGSGSVSLGGGLTFTGTGITQVIASGSTLTVSSTETDTLASVTGRGSLTSTILRLNGGVTTTTTTPLALDSGTTGSINIGTSAYSKTITIGNMTGTTGLAFNAGSGSIQFQSGAVTINTNTKNMGLGTSKPGARLSFGVQESPVASLYLYEDSDTRTVRGFGNGLAEISRNELSIFTSQGDDRDGAITIGEMNTDFRYIPKLTIKTYDGFVGISTADPRHLLDMGDSGGYYDETVGKWVEGSDLTYKKDIADLNQYGLDTIIKLHPVSYKLKNSGVSQIGFIAQEVKEIVPEVVFGEDGHMGLSYGEFVPILVKAIQEQQTEISRMNEHALMKNSAITFSDTVTFDKTPVVKKGIEMVDQMNGDIFCVYISNGEWKKEKINCDNIVITASDTTIVPTPSTIDITPQPSIAPIIDDQLTEDTTSSDSAQQAH